MDYTIFDGYPNAYDATGWDACADAPQAEDYQDAELLAFDALE